MGPTASGKTDLAVALAALRPLDLISVDSAMVFRGMDIGTAKPEASVLARAPHQLIDIRDPLESYSAARFREDALEAIRRSHSSDRIPLLVGGTMLYFRALRSGLSDVPAADPDVRRALLEEAARRGWEDLHRELAGVDPAAAARIHPNDSQRIQRALEVFRISGQPLSKLQTRRQPPRGLRFLNLALMPPDRDILHRRIEQRFRAMLAAGFVDEVRALRNIPGLGLDHPSMRAVGYRQVWDYLDGKQDVEAMTWRGIYASRQFAKRQLTWLRGEPELRSLSADGSDLTTQALSRIDRFLEAA
ncbi:tRNA (adenosine(37)-N6)-dimethylallyltransferase MiaA [Methylonatrum kenyense]|uniref:tRNA (adenosine(37)-N6)-dimethylallyltransferase MiaA n=1 Tax=Methylonatrum kenyense TaxID=455253 RepID=UPI0020BEFD45|nr:tRNA (adenosine(37)-N6)-dimethylallyltransferase MiaA [Methylonatrum kenyense]MCK8516120.1 tRNA (adenosine(37)-N6)-dimethylallyltransferase MiaA [Methylonatrum kenyense]